MPRVIANRSVRRLWVGQTTSHVGDWFLRIALPLYVLARTGSVTDTSLTFLCAYVPALVMGPLAGALVEGWDHRRTMICADLVRAGIVSLLFLDPNARAIWAVYLVAGVGASVSEFFAPARSAIIPALVAPEDLARANGTMSIGSELALLIGPALGGLTYGIGGLRSAVVVDALSYLWSAGATWGLPRTPKTSRTSPAGVATTFEALRSGLSLARRDQLLRALLTSNVVLSVGAGILSVAIVTLVRHHLEAAGFQYGLLLSAQAVGGITGAWLSRRVSSRLTNKAWVLLTTALIGLAVAGVAASPTWWLVALVLFIGGAPTTINTVVITILVQVTPPPDFRARTSSVYRWTTFAGGAIGTILAAPLTSASGSQVALVCSAAFIGISTAVVAAMMPGPVRSARPHDGSSASSSRATYLRTRHAPRAAE